jgi:hypothetical protein
MHVREGSAAHRQRRRLRPDRTERGACWLRRRTNPPKWKCHERCVWPIEPATRQRVSAATRPKTITTASPSRPWRVTTMSTLLYPTARNSLPVAPARPAPPRGREVRRRQHARDSVLKVQAGTHYPIAPGVSRIQRGGRRVPGRPASLSTSATRWAFCKSGWGTRHGTAAAERWLHSRALVC